MKSLLIVVGLLIFTPSFAQVPEDSITIMPVKLDTPLRITNLYPSFSLHVDSALAYNLELNKDEAGYYWYMKNALPGLRINKDNGLLSFKGDKSFFISGKLKYDFEYKIDIGVQSLNDAKDKIDTTFNIIFYNTDVVPSRVKPTVTGTQYIQEGDSIFFRVLCESGIAPIEDILFKAAYLYQIIV